MAYSEYRQAGIGACGHAGVDGGIAAALVSMTPQCYLKRILRLLALAGILAIARMPAHAQEQASMAIGQWRFTKPLDSSEITALNDEGARRLGGTVFTISKEKIKFGTRECLPPSLEEHWVEPRLYLREQAHASAENLHLPNPVTVVELGCTIAFVRDRNRLVIHWKGWFFDAVRVAPTPTDRKQRGRLLRYRTTTKELESYRKLITQPL